MIARKGENPFENLSNWFGAYLEGCSNRDDEEKEEKEAAEKEAEALEEFSSF